MKVILVFLIPVLLVLCPIYFSFEPKLTSSQKVCYFLMLPIVEIVISAIAILLANSMDVSIIDHWQLYLLYFLFSLGMATTLIVVLVEVPERTVKLSIRLGTLALFGFILTCVFLLLK